MSCSGPGVLFGALLRKRGRLDEVVVVVEDEVREPESPVLDGAAGLLQMQRREAEEKKRDRKKTKLEEQKERKRKEEEEDEDWQKWKAKAREVVNTRWKAETERREALLKQEFAQRAKEATVQLRNEMKQWYLSIKENEEKRRQQQRESIAVADTLIDSD